MILKSSFKRKGFSILRLAGLSDKWHIPLGDIRIVYVFLRDGKIE